MKKILPSLMTLLSLYSTANAQLLSKARVVTSNEISPVLKDVITDYPNYFKNIITDTLEQTPGYVNFGSTASVPGKDSAIITRYGEAEEHVYSWKNVLLETADFDEAKKKFYEYYLKIKKTTLVLDNLGVAVEGNYTEPEEDKKFTSVLLHVASINEKVRDLVVELNLQYEISDWSITMSVYNYKDVDFNQPDYRSGF